MLKFRAETPQELFAATHPAARVRKPLGISDKIISGHSGARGRRDYGSGVAWAADAPRYPVVRAESTPLTSELTLLPSAR
jgi:hypothetical protein